MSSSKLRAGADSHHLPEGSTRWLQRAAVAITALLPLTVLPVFEHPFSLPKTLLLGGFVLVGGVAGLMSGGLSRPKLPMGFSLALTVWASSVAISALLGKFVSIEVFCLYLFSIGWLLLITALRPSALHLAMAAVSASAVISTISVLQYVDLDPFRFLGWSSTPYGSPRMRVFGTLGNPNFVAAFLVAGIPLTMAVGKVLKRDMLFSSLVILEAAAVFATGSRAALLGIAASLFWLGLVKQLSVRCLIASGALLLMALPFFVQSRTLAATVDGRFYIWRVVASHAVESPLFGYGPGAFEPKYIQWETEYWRDGKGSADERVFAALQKHAHNDYLETLVNSGVAGLLGLLFLLWYFFVSAYQRALAPGGELIAGASAGAAAMCAVAMVDFPLQRPAEQFMLWTLIGIVYITSQTSTQVWSQGS